ncbi:AraC family transcriptional regulator [Parabacteroides sp. PFB2-10]|uniref:AraC family transcriptional regulator n=1 Tax=Parabacteroides sp. PFB2-10 TaxID=1742405 RepID=UPI002473FC9E|nr:AraC family transcriptional regulator [Parabacteroides sp. PFB2-10]MDL2244711.1 AraC family transcriptional regulator [Parabacteroides sp. OttesenSCG-928-J18]
MPARKQHIYVFLFLWSILFSACEKEKVENSLAHEAFNPEEFRIYQNELLPDSLLPLVLEKNKQANENHDLALEMMLTNILVNRSMLSGEYEEGLGLANHFLQGVVQKGDSSAIYQAYYNVGRLYYGQGLADMSLDYFLKAAQYPMTEKEKCRIYYAIGEASRSSNTVEGVNSEEYYSKSEEIAHSLNDAAMITISCFGQSQVYYAGFDAYKDMHLPMSKGKRDSLLYSTELLKKGLSYDPNAKISRAALGLNYCALKELDKAWEHIEYSVTECLKIPDQTPIGLNILSSYYICAGRYDEAIATSEESYAFAEKRNKKGDMCNSASQLYYAYKYKGDARKALEALETEKRLVKEIESAERSLKVIAGQIEHNTRLKEEELYLAQVKETFYRRINLLLFSACLLFLLLLVFIIRLNNKNRHAYKELVKRSREWAAYNHPLPIREEKESATEQQPPTENDRDIIQATRERIVQDELYKDPTLTLGSISKLLSIKRTTLSQAINRSTGNNFNFFINEFRVKEAIFLMESDKNHPPASRMSMEEIAFDSGFNDRVSFYRAFKKVTGLSPTDFRKNL